MDVGIRRGVQLPRRIAGGDERMKPGLMKRLPRSDTDLSTPARKRQFNELHFAISAPRYDLATRILSFGQDAKWKHYLINALPPLSRPFCLDLACGTGDITFALAERFPQGQIEGLDITPAMLDIARRRNRYQHVVLVQKEMCPLDYPDCCADLIVGGYALRNAPDLKHTLTEIHRVLKPGGIGAFLDFSKPKNRVLQSVEYQLLKMWGGLWGLLLHGDVRVHGYISASLKGYPDRDRLQYLLRKLGFEILRRKQFLLGIIEVVVVRKTAS